MDRKEGEVGMVMYIGYSHSPSFGCLHAIYHPTCWQPNMLAVRPAVTEGLLA